MCAIWKLVVSVVACLLTEIVLGPLDC